MISQTQHNEIKGDVVTLALVVFISNILQSVIVTNKIFNEVFINTAYSLVLGLLFYHLIFHQLFNHLNLNVRTKFILRNTLKLLSILIISEIIKSFSNNVPFNFSVEFFINISIVALFYSIIDLLLNDPLASQNAEHVTDLNKNQLINYFKIDFLKIVGSGFLILVLINRNSNFADFIRVPCLLIAILLYYLVFSKILSLKLVTHAIYILILIYSFNFVYNKI